MNAPHLKQALGSPLLKSLTPQEIEELDKLFEYKRFIAGASIFLENMDGEYMYLILRGTVKISRMLAEGNERILVVLGPEDVFGELSLLDPGAREATARVVEEVQLAYLSRDRFDLLCRQAPRLALKMTLNLVQVLAHRVRAVNNDYREIIQVASRG